MPREHRSDPGWLSLAGIVWAAPVEDPQIPCRPRPSAAPIWTIPLRLGSHPRRIRAARPCLPPPSQPRPFPVPAAARMTHRPDPGPVPLNPGDNRCAPPSMPRSQLSARNVSRPSPASSQPYGTGPAHTTMSWLTPMSFVTRVTADPASTGLAWMDCAMRAATPRRCGGFNDKAEPDLGELNIEDSVIRDPPVRCSPTGADPFRETDWMSRGIDSSVCRLAREGKKIAHAIKVQFDGYEPSNEHRG